MKASIVVSVRNNQEMIGECIESLLSQDFPKNEFEIIVVDNDSTDETARVIKKYPVTYIFEEKIGRAHASNAGIRNACGELIAFTDSDCIADKGWLRELISGFNSEDIGGVGGEILGYKPKTILEKFAIATGVLSNKWVFSEREERNKRKTPSFIRTANAVYRRKVLEEVGLFDENLQPGYDADLSWRVQWAGYKIKLMHTALIFHKHRTTLRGLFEQFFRYGFTRTILMKKHKKRFNKTVFIDPIPYIALFYFLMMTVPSLIFAKDTEMKFRPIFQIIKNFAYICGKILGSIKNRVMVL